MISPRLGSVQKKQLTSYSPCESSRRLLIPPSSDERSLSHSYYEHLNPMTSILDPALHTKDWVRSHSPFLFSAILAVATKVLRPSAYGPSFRFCNALFGQAFEHGVCSVELVQALATFLFWIDTTDPSGAAKLAYAIRSAMDCGMHRQKKRPLPRDEYQARLTLSAERTWFYLTIADHR